MAGVLRMHVMHLDHYMLDRVCDIDGHDEKVSCSTVRLFGSIDGPSDRITLACNIHGTFQYFYFRPENVRDTTFATISLVQSYLPSFKFKLENSLKKLNGQRVIYRLEAVQKKSMYGYFKEAVPFVKVSVFNPSSVKSLVKALESGVLGTAMMTYESHISFLLQFAMDNNVQPQGWVTLSRCKFRRPVSVQSLIEIFPCNNLSIFIWETTSLISDVVTNIAENSETFENALQVESQLRSDAEAVMQGVTLSQLVFSQPFSLAIHENPAVNSESERVNVYIEKTCTCALECDTCVEFIVNREEMHSSFGKELWDEETARRQQRGLADRKAIALESTPTDHRVLEQHEKELLERVESLYAKGRALESSARDSEQQDWLTQQHVAESAQLTQDEQLQREYNAVNVRVGIEVIGQEADVSYVPIARFDEHGDYSDEQEELAQSAIEAENIVSQSQADFIGAREEEVEAVAPVMQEELSREIDSPKMHEAICGSSAADVGTVKPQAKRSLASAFSRKSLPPLKSHRQTPDSSRVLFFNDVVDLTAPIHFPLASRSPSQTTPSVKSVSISASPLISQPSQGLTEANLSTGIRLLPTYKSPTYSVVLDTSECLNERYPRLVYSDARDAMTFQPPPLKCAQFHGICENPCTLSVLLNMVAAENIPFPTHARFLVPPFRPPSYQTVLSHMYTPTLSSSAVIRDSTQIDTPIKTNANCARSNKHSMKVAAVLSSRSRMVTVSLEVFSCNRVAASGQQLIPCPKVDPVQMVMWCCSEIALSSEEEIRATSSGLICLIQTQPLAEVSESSTRRIRSPSYQRQCLSCDTLPLDFCMQIVNTEKELFQLVIERIRQIDPDIIVGYEVQKSSLGYLVQRAESAMGLDLLRELSRVPSEIASKRNEYDVYDEEHESGIFITGRIVLNMWRIVRKELPLTSFSLENATLQLLNKTVPFFTHQQLTRWFRAHKLRNRVVRHVYRRVELNILMLDKLDFLRRTSELARLYGIDFYSAISRGSQYKVEAVLLRRAHSEGFIAIAPSKAHVANQNGMEVVPLILEPPSKFYGDPVVVLDFQSLYPSMMIAYNICFTTILGKVTTRGKDNADTTQRLGVIDYPERMTATCLHDHAIQGAQPHLISNGSLFCSKDIRIGIIPKMLSEMLATRQMLKKAIKDYDSSDDEILRRVLDARQLAIKLLMNVTYGYSAAGFSGRMPMAEVADAIVQRGRDTLKWSIDIVNSHYKWKAKVLYGDTDSMFIYLKGRDKQEAFTIGEEISNYISSKCPPDVVLKFEKVYLPCILVTMKRYVGYKFETADGEGHFEAKGIEVVRRDQCPAVGKIQEQALRILFSTRDLSAVKSYLTKQWKKMSRGGMYLSIKDFVFAKEVRLGTYRGMGPPGAVVAMKMRDLDPNSEPPYGWRVPYVVVTGISGGGQRLMDLVIPPEHLMLRGSGYSLNVNYYILKCINPALERVLSLCGVKLSEWYTASVKISIKTRRVQYVQTTKKKTGMLTMENYFASSSCEFCNSASLNPICNACLQDKQRVYATVVAKLNQVTVRQHNLEQICNNCTKHPQIGEYMKRDELIGSECCSSVSCSVFVDRYRLITKIEDMQHVLSMTKW